MKRQIVIRAGARMLAWTLKLSRHSNHESSDFSLRKKERKEGC